MAKLSYSALETFRTCPLKYKFAYVDKIPVAQSGSMQFGSLMHKVMEELYSHQMLPISKEELQHLFSSKWNSHLYQDSYTADIEFQTGLSIIEREWEKKQNQPEPLTIAREKYFLLPLAEGFELSGRIDRIDKVGEDSLEIIDYKTGRSVPSEEEVRNNLQLAIYHLALLKLWPTTKEVTLSLYYLRPDMKVGFVADPALLEKAKLALADLVEQIRTTNYAPTPGGHCDHCDFQDRCPMRKHKSDVALHPEDPVIQEGAFLADRYLNLMAQKKANAEEIEAAKAGIEQYLAVTGYQTIAGKQGTVRKLVTKTRRLQGKKVQEYLASQNVLEQFIETSESSRLITQAKDVPDIEEVL